MHALALARSLLAPIEEETQAQGLKRVRRIRLEMARLSGVEPQLAFEMAARHSCAKGADVEVLNPEAWWFSGRRDVAWYEWLQDQRKNLPSARAAKLESEPPTAQASTP